jgi:predicted AAA+ superfamily ATPase
MISRSILKETKETANDFKVVCVTGPRQSGKTTLCKQVFKNKPYVP